MDEFDLARQKVSAPATALTVVGAISGFLSCVSVVIQPLTNPALLEVSADDPESIGRLTGLACVGLLWSLIPFVIAYAGLKMKELRAKAFVQAAAAMCLIPCCVNCACWPCTAIIGVWVLVTLQKPDVVRAYEEVARL